MRKRLVIAVVLLSVVGLPTAWATTIIPAADPGELAVDSQAVFLARAGASSVVARSGYLSTATELEVLEVVKGPITIGEMVTTLSPGGEQDGIVWAVVGSPKLVAGEVYLFFSDRGEDGRWRPRLAAESVLRREEAADGAKLLVPLAEARKLQRITVKGDGAALVPGRVEESGFKDALQRRLAGEPGWDWSRLAVRSDEGPDFLKAAPSGCEFMEYSEDNLPIRWRKFDTGGTQSMAAESTGDGDLLGGGFSELQGALARWNAVSSSSISVSYGGAGVSPFNPASCTEDTDGTMNAVIFGDPCDEMGDLSNCSGTLAFGGPSFYSSTYSWDGQQWHQAVQWFMVVNEGTGACLSPYNYELMLTHELGHGLGFDHVSDSGALMYANCCNDHNALDVECAQYIYPASAPTPTPTRTPTRAPTLHPTITPSVTPTRTPTRTPTLHPSITPSYTPTRTPTPTSTPAAFTPTPTSVPQSNEVMVPVVVHDEGEGGVNWRSDVVLSNPNSRQQWLRFTYLTESKASYSATRILPAFSTLMLEDLVATLFGAGNGKGPLEVEVLTAGSDPPVVVSRAYAQNSFGNLGSGLPSDVQPSTEQVSMPGLFHDNAFRSNIAVTAADVEVWATFDLFRGIEGRVAGDVQRRIDPGEQKQWAIDKLFSGYPLDGVPMTVRVSLSRPGIAYASMVDNLSTDSAVFLGKQPAAQWVVPVVARVDGNDGTFWSSSVSLWNSTGVTAWLELEYLPEKTDNSAGGVESPLVRLNPYATKTLSDILRNQFGIDDGKGVLLVRGSQPITVTSRVFTACEVCPDGGSSGNGVRSVPVSAMSSETAVLPGVRILDGFRTNVGFVTGDLPSTFTCRLFDEDGIMRAMAFVSVPARSMKQRSVEQIFGNSGYVKPDPAGMITVEGSSDFLVYLTVIDGTSQDPVFIMPQ